MVEEACLSGLMMVKSMREFHIVYFLSCIDYLALMPFLFNFGDKGVWDMIFIPFLGEEINNYFT